MVWAQHWDDEYVDNYEDEDEAPVSGVVGDVGEPMPVAHLESLWPGDWIEHEFGPWARGGYRFSWREWAWAWVDFGPRGPRSWH